jgi:aminomethyltransferase
VWNALLRRGAKPAGLAARDTLRTEACYHLYGNDLSTERGPIEAGLGWACRSEGGYIGAEAVAAARASAPAEKLVPFIVLDRGAARPGDQVVGGGVVTSGTFSPSLQAGIGMAYLPAAAAVVGTEFEIDVRGKLRRARVERRPLLKV